MIRRVVTGPTGYVEDGTPPNTIEAPSGFGVSELLWLDGPATSATDGRDRTDGGWPLEPPAGGLSSRIIRMPGGGDWLRVDGDDPNTPGMHATDTLDLMVVLDGEILMGLPSGEHLVRAGECVVQRGTAHRWKVPEGGSCTYWVTMLRPGPAGPSVSLSRTGGSSGVRRFVTRSDGVDIDEGPLGLEAGATRIVDVWHTGGPVADVTQGGDPEGPWELEPPAGGTWLRLLDLSPSMPDVEALWHTTRSIDIDVVLSGQVEHDLREGGTVVLSRGDVLVQRETEHRWRPVGPEPYRMASLMIELASS